MVPSVSGEDLDELDEARILAHFQCLSAADRRARFGQWMKDTSLQLWLSRMDWASQRLWHPHDAGDPIVALAQLVPDTQQNTCEVGLSVIPSARGQGWGRILLDHAIANARHLTPGGTLWLQGSANNQALRRLCAGMPTQTHEGEIYVTLPL